MNTARVKSLVCLSFGFVLTLCFAVAAQGQGPVDTNRLETGGQYDIKPPPTNMMFQITDNPTNAGDDNLIWSNSGRMLAVDRSDPNAPMGASGNKYICLLDVRNLGNIQTIGARSSAVTNPLFANITGWTWNDDRVLFGWQPQISADPPSLAKCRLMSCTSGTGAMSVVNFLMTDPQGNPTNHIYSPSVLYDQFAGKERLLFLVSSAGNNPTGPGPGERINLYTVTYDSGGVPNWSDRVQLTDFNTNLSIQSVKWCPELGTNYQPICNRLEILLSTPPPMGLGNGEPVEENSRIIIFNNVRGVIEGSTPPPITLDNPCFMVLETNMVMNSQVSWTFDGQYVMYGRMGTNPPPAPPSSDLYSKRSDSPTNTAVKFEVPASITGGQKQWLSISPDGMKAAFTVDHKVYVIPMQFDNIAVTGAVVTNVLTDASYTAVNVSGDAIPSNTTFNIVAPPTVDTNNFNGEFSGFAREISVSGVSTQFDLMTNAEMTLHFSEADIPDGVSATNLAIYVYNPQGTNAGQTGSWDKLDSVIDTNKQTISAEVQHFSIYAIGRASAQPQPVTVVLADPVMVSASGGWYVWFSGSGYQRGGPWSLGVSGTPVAADFDGDGYADPAVVDQDTGVWSVWFSSLGYQMGGPWSLGVSGTPVTGDFDGDGYADPAMVSASGGWRVWFTSLGYQMGGPWSLGVSGTPVAADFDGDLYADPAMVSSSGAWRVWFTSLGYQMGGPYSLGVSGTPVAGDFDGDGYADPVMVDSTGAWRVWFTSLGYQMGGPWSLGVSGTPLAADFDGQ